jgi:hypothetical protein
MKFGNEKSRDTVYLGSLFSNEYWEQFNNKIRSKR